MPGSTRWPATAIFSMTTPAMGEWMVSVRLACPLSSSSRICCGERSQRRSRSRLAPASEAADTRASGSELCRSRRSVSRARRYSRCAVRSSGL